MPLVDELMNEEPAMEPKVALANALAVISGYTEESTMRSVLSCSRNYVTVLAETTNEIRSAGYVFSQIEKVFDWDLRQNVRGMTLLATKLGAVFDCPSSRVGVVCETSKPWIKFSKIDVIPELLAT
eukprot:UN10658